MPYKNEDDEIECDIIESYGVFFKANSQGAKSWNKEINMVSWNGRPAKIDIRSWQKDHEKCGKGIALTWEEAEELVKLLNAVLKKKPEKPKANRKSAISVPRELEPYYDELELLFGEGPDKCKSARNTLLKKYHPDRNAVNLAFATRKTIKIKDAYDRITAWWNDNQK
jgi:hypothetical protein